MTTPLRSWEIVLYALHLEGGVVRSVATEDVASRCYQLAPDAFSWVKYQQYPDKEIVRNHLIRHRVGQHGGKYATGRAGRTHQSHGKPTSDGWRLTQDGARWIAENRARLEEALGHREPRTDRQALLRVLKRVREHSLFQEFSVDPQAFVPRLGDLAELLRCRVDAEEDVWRQRLESLRTQAELASQPDVVEFVGRCELLRPALR